jgi:hypothetical protein
VSWSQAVASGTVAGTITDQSGAVVADAQVKLTDTATGTSRNAATDNSGHYIFVNVDPGHYGLTAAKSGFATSKTSSDVKVGQTSTLNLVNVLNHNQLLDPVLDGCNTCSSGFGQLTNEGSLPRRMEFGIRLNF